MFAWPIFITGIFIVVVGGVAYESVRSIDAERAAGAVAVIGAIVMIGALFYGTAADGWFA